MLPHIPLFYHLHERALRLCTGAGYELRNFSILFLSTSRQHYFEPRLGRRDMQNFDKKYFVC